MEAIILAGGLGTRLKSAVPDLPKPMAPILDRPFLSYQLDYWIAQGIRHFVLAVAYKFEAIQTYFGSQYKGAQISYSVEEVPLGTGGGLLLALDQLKSADPFMVLNGDTYFEAKIEAMHHFQDLHHADLTFGLHRVEENSRYSGIELQEDFRITAIKARAPSGGSLLINGGAYLFKSSDVLADFSKGAKISLEDEIFPALLGTSKRIYGLVCPGRFLDIGIPEDYLKAETLLPLSRSN